MMFIIQSQEVSENIFPDLVRRSAMPFQLILKTGKALKQGIEEMLLPECLPETLHRLEFRRISRQENQPDIVRNTDLSAVMPSLTIQDK